DSKRNAAQNRVEHLVEFKQADVLKTDVKPATVVTLYLLPEVNLDLRPILLRDLKPGTRVVSHDFDMGDWEPKEEVDMVDGSGHYHTIYLWEIPAEEPATAH